MSRDRKKKSTRRTLNVEQLQARDLMAADLAMVAMPHFDLDVSNMHVEEGESVKNFRST